MAGPRAANHRRGLLLAFLCVGVFVVYLDATIVNVALPEIQQDLSTGIRQLQWIIDAYALAFGCLLLTAGTLGDILGRRRIFLGALLGFTAASAACALSTSIEMLLVARAAQGLCGSVLIPVSLALVSSVYDDPGARARALGTWAGMGGLALSAGPVLGGLLVDSLGWQSIFWVNVPVGVVAAAALLRLLTEQRTGRTRRLDPVGQVLFVAVIAALTYALIEGNNHGWRSALIVGLFAGGAVVLVLFGWWELRHPDPMLPPRMLRSPVMIVAATVNFLGLFGLFATNFLLTLYLQTVNGLSALETGVRWLALTVPIMVMSFLASVLTSKIGARWPIVAGSALAAGGLLGLARLEVGSGFGSYWWALMLLGAGVSLTGAPATVALLASVPRSQAGTASGVFNTFRQLGAVFGVALSGALLLRRLGLGAAGALAGIPMPDQQRARVIEMVGNGDVTQLDQLPAELRRSVLAAIGPVFMDGMRLAMVVAAVGTLVGGVLTWPFLSRAARRGQPPDPPEDGEAGARETGTRQTGVAPAAR